MLKFRDCYFGIVLGIISAIILFFGYVVEEIMLRASSWASRWSIPTNLSFHLAAKYIPPMSLSLGIKVAVVVSSLTMAMEVIKTHDHIFAGRIVNQVATLFSHLKSSIKTVSTMEILFNHRKLKTGKMSMSV